MKKFICNIGALALGVLASIMAFIPMFDTKTMIGDKTIWSEEVFSIFSCPYSDFESFKDTFRVITMVLAIIAIAAFVILAITIVMDFLGGKKSKMAGIKKLASLILVIVAVLIVIAQNARIPAPAKPSATERYANQFEIARPTVVVIPRFVSLYLF